MSVKLGVSITTPADWRLTVRNAGDEVIGAWSGQGAAAEVTWGGSSGGAVVPDGVYTAELTATSAGVEAVPVTQTITVDTAAPRLANAVADPLSFSPNGDARTETTTATYSPDEACAVRVGIMDANGKVLRWLHGWRARGTGSYRVAWDGKIGSGSSLAAAADGSYRFDIERRDAAGNIARRGVGVVLDRTLGFPTAAPLTLSPNGDGARDTTKLGFKLTRRAAVTLTVRQSAEVVRTLELGTLEAGAHTATWDGRADSGEYLASGRPVFTVTAESTLGESSVSKTLVVDLYRPRIYAPKAKTARRGTTTRLGFKARDPYSAKVDVRYVVTDAKGRRVASGHPGWLRAGKGLSALWKPRSRGVFTVTWRAIDRGGNREASRTRTIVTVR